MSTPMDHIAYLSQEIGPRPAGTEEEQQAALYITERLQKDAHLSAQIEDFTCNSDALMTPIICYAVAFVAVILGVLLPVVAIPAAVISLVATALIALEAFDHPTISQLFTKGVSQNVVAKYEPTRNEDAAGSRRRKVIVVANYDSGKVRREASGVFVRALWPLRLASLGGSVAAAFFMMIRALFAGEGAASLVLCVLSIVCILPAAVQLAFALMEKFGPFVEAANNNASGVAVMLEVARRLGNGEVSSDSPIASSEEISFSEVGRAPTSVSDNLVQLKDEPISASSIDSNNQRRETAKALSVAPAGTLAEAAAKAQALSEEHIQAAEQAALEESIRAQKEAEEARLAEEARINAENAAIAAAEKASQASHPASVPDWYKKATEKAREKKAESEGKAEEPQSYRSRFADYPTADSAQIEEEPNFPEASEDAAAVSPSIEAPKPSADIYSAYSEDSVVVDSTPSVDEPQILVVPDEVRSETLSEPAFPQEQNAEEPQFDAAAQTTRLPQMMYYTAPADRSAIQAERAQKERVVVRANEEFVDSSQNIPGQSAGLQAYEAAVANQNSAVLSGIPEVNEQPAVEPKVISARIPVVDLPSIELPPMVAPEPKPISFNELRQRAPLAEAHEPVSPRKASQDYLAANLPSVGESSAMPPASRGAYEVDPVQKTQNSNVSLTGSFAAIGSIGAQPVGDELLEGLGPDDIYVDDADDSVFQEDFTETGAFAGAGYVEMPQSRMGKFFGKFRRNKNKDSEESAQEWLGVDESFDARSVGKARGSWESFRDEDDWEGGAFSNLRARMKPAGSSDPMEPDSRLDGEGDRTPQTESAAAPAVSADSFASAYEAALRHAESSSDKIETADDIQQIYSFAAGDINTEVWFVALGSELANNGGIKAFLAAHASEMRGAIVVNLEALGSGAFSYLDREGDLKQVKCSPRMKRFIKKASQSSNVQISPAQINWKESPASYAAKHRVQAMSLVGMDGFAPAHYAQPDDVLESIDPASLDAAADFVVEFLKNI